MGSSVISPGRAPGVYLRSLAHVGLALGSGAQLHHDVGVDLGRHHLLELHYVRVPQLPQDFDLRDAPREGRAAQGLDLRAVGRVETLPGSASKEECSTDHDTLRSCHVGIHSMLHP